MEQPKFERRISPSPELEKKDREGLREIIFQQLVQSKILEHFHDELDDADIPAEALNEISSTFYSLSEDNKRAVLAIPAQLRPALFTKYAERIRKGELSGTGVVFDILEKAQKYGFTIGFHLSPRDIRADKDGSWVVKGTEPDHRHDDLPMAYYSMDYAHRYLKKPAQFLYVVRSEVGETSSHYRDNDASWGHASSLSIVDKIDMKALEEEMNERSALMDKAMGGQKKEGDAGAPPPIS
ncbi:MAG: hypothetical protein JWL82_309 [Parcubacteria group bacterium]|nr:hypothetical protein [Parcubacteria group bacterium]